MTSQPITQDQLSLRWPEMLEEFGETPFETSPCIFRTCLAKASFRMKPFLTYLHPVTVQKKVETSV